MSAKIMKLLPATAGSTPLSREPDILARFEEALHRCGVVGDVRIAKLTYLALTSRLLDRPISLCVKGASAAGKSFPVEQTLLFLPESAFLESTAMSPRALVYSKEPFEHRMLIFFELAGIPTEAEYILRSLLSEGKIRYQTVAKNSNDQWGGTVISKDGPTGVIITTTEVRLHPENETRFFTVPADDSAEQTRDILRAQAAGPTPKPDFGPWHEHQEFLAKEVPSIEVPFARLLADLLPTNSLRIRRDFSHVLALIRVHALLHCETRERDDSGRVLATLEDYRAVYDLVEDILAHGLEMSVPPEVREVVAEVARILSTDSAECVEGLEILAKALNVDKSTISRRKDQAIDLGFLVNAETRTGQRTRLRLGDPLPGDTRVLPTPAELAAKVASAARPSEGEVPA